MLDMLQSCVVVLGSLVTLFLVYRIRVTGKYGWKLRATAVVSVGVVAAATLLPFPSRRTEPIGTSPTESTQVAPVTSVASKNLIEAQLPNAQLDGKDLSSTVLYAANLEGAQLNGANLNSVDMSRANLTGASLVKASLRKANLQDANLSRADLAGADLGDALLVGTNLDCTNLLGAIGLTKAHLAKAKLFPNSRYASDLAPSDEHRLAARTRETLEAYYLGLNSGVFEASRYFADSVERFLLMQNTSPRAIEDYVKNVLPQQFRKSEYSLVPCSLTLEDVQRREFVYQEEGSAYVVAQRVQQKVLVQVRVRVDNQGKLEYVRQFKVLRRESEPLRDPSTQD